MSSKIQVHTCISPALLSGRQNSCSGGLNSLRVPSAWWLSELTNELSFGINPPKTRKYVSGTLNMFLSTASIFQQIFKSLEFTLKTELATQVSLLRSAMVWFQMLPGSARLKIYETGQQLALMIKTGQRL